MKKILVLILMLSLFSHLPAAKEEITKQHQIANDYLDQIFEPENMDILQAGTITEKQKALHKNFSENAEQIVDAIESANEDIIFLKQEKPEEPEMATAIQEMLQEQRESLRNGLEHLKKLFDQLELYGSTYKEMGGYTNALQAFAVDDPILKFISKTRGVLSEIPKDELTAVGKKILKYTEIR